MRIQKVVRFLLPLFAFPLWFLLHVINENFWLIPFQILLEEFLQYLLNSAVVGATAYFLFKHRNKAIFFSYIVLTLYFLFGWLKDQIDQVAFLKVLRPYTVLLPFLFALVIVVFIFVRRSKRTFEKPVFFFLTFLLINLVLELGILTYRLVTNAKERNDHGDAEHNVIKTHSFSKNDRSPDVYWLLFDEYASARSMEKAWGFRNPIDSVLAARGFFVADSATSNYNYTPYSLLSTMDMQYLRDYKNHDHVNAIDIAKSTYGMKETNVVSIFEKLGYKIFNYSIYDFEDHPSKGDVFFDYLPRTLITTRTLTCRIRKNIGWNFENMFSADKAKSDSIRKMKGLLQLDRKYDALFERSFEQIRNSSQSKEPGFYFFHFQVPHEPYMYDSSGTVQYHQGTNHTAANYLKHVTFANKMIVSFADSILKNATNRDIVIIISGDHGFKFDEGDPAFETEGCKILYAVYNSDKDHTLWYRRMSPVNSFRILFNKYFNAKMPLLKDTSYNLLYRQD